MQRKTMSEEASAIIFKIIDINNLNILQTLFTEGVNLNIQNPEGETPLIYASRLKRFDMLIELAKYEKEYEDAEEKEKQRLDIEIKKNTDKLFSAIDAKDIVRIRQFVKGNIDLTITAHGKYTPIEWAAKNKCWEAAIAIAPEIKADNQNKAGLGSALFDAVRKNEVIAAKEMLKCKKEDDDDFWWRDTESKYTILHWAVNHDSTELVRLLVDAGADITCENYQNMTPIHLAVKMDHWQCVIELAKEKNFQNLDKDLHRVWLKAMRENQIDIVRALLLTSAKRVINGWHRSGDKAAGLHIVIELNNPEMVSILLDAGADINKKNAKGLTPIELAAELGFWQYVIEIAKRKEDPENDANFASVLIYSVWHNQIEAVRALLKAKARTNRVRQRDNASLLNLAVEADNLEMITLLLDHDVDLNKKNKSGQTPLKLAIDLKRWECAKAIIKKIPMDVLVDQGLPYLTVGLFNDIVRSEDFYLDQKVSELRRPLLIHILSLPADEKKPYLEKALDKTTSLGRLFLEFKQTRFEKIMRYNQSAEWFKNRIREELAMLEDKFRKNVSSHAAMLTLIDSIPVLDREDHGVNVPLLSSTDSSHSMIPLMPIYLDQKEGKELSTNDFNRLFPSVSNKKQKDNTNTVKLASMVNS